MSTHPPIPPADPPPPSQQRSLPPRRHRARRILLLLVFLLAAWFSRFAYLRIAVRPTLQPEYWKARIAALDPPPEGALAADQAYTLLTPRSWLDLPEVQAGLRQNGEWRLAWSIPWDGNRLDIAGADAAFTSEGFRRACDKLRDALQMGWLPRAKIGRGWVMDDWLIHHFEWAGWFVVHSRWSRERGPGVDVAVADWLDAVRLGRQASRARSVDSEVFASIIYDVTAGEMIFTAGEPHSPIDTCRLATTIDGIIGPMVRPSEMFEGERLCIHAHLEAIYAGDGHDWLVLSEAARYTALGWTNAGASRLWNLASPIFHDSATARKAVDPCFTRLDACGDLAACARLLQASPMGRGQSCPGPLDGVLYSFPNGCPDRVLQAHFEARATLDAAIRMLALAEYHRECHRYPDRLEDLIPRFLPRLPIDCADLQALRYRRLEGKYLLYSIGPNGVDDGGDGKSPLDSSSEPQWPCRGDIVFNLAERPARPQQ